MPSSSCVDGVIVKARENFKNRPTTFMSPGFVNLYTNGEPKMFSTYDDAAEAATDDDYIATVQIIKQGASLLIDLSEYGGIMKAAKEAGNRHA